MLSPMIPKTAIDTLDDVVFMISRETLTRAVTRAKAGASCSTGAACSGLRESRLNAKIAEGERHGKGTFHSQWRHLLGAEGRHEVRDRLLGRRVREPV